MRAAAERNRRAVQQQLGDDEGLEDIVPAAPVKVPEHIAKRLDKRHLRRKNSGTGAGEGRGRCFIEVCPPC